MNFSVRKLLDIYIVCYFFLLKQMFALCINVAWQILRFKKEGGHLYSDWLKCNVIYSDDFILVTMDLQWIKFLQIPFSFLLGIPRRQPEFGDRPNQRQASRLHVQV